jgi:uncharacterized coiled-coil protein SlyX
VKSDLTKEELDVLLDGKQDGETHGAGAEQWLQESMSRMRRMSEQLVQLQEDLHRMQLKVELLEERVSSLQAAEGAEQAASDKPALQPTKRDNREAGHPFEITRKEKFKRRRLF